MLNDYEIIIMNVSENHIDIINLKAQTLFQTKHKFMVTAVERLELETFIDSQYFCIV